MTLPSFPPLMACASWWECYLAALLRGGGESEAIASANRLGGLRRRDWMRMSIAGGAVLSLPVRGGASALKNRDPESWEMAPEAVRERRKAAATLATVYGREPFFRFLDHELLIPEAPTARETCVLAFHAVSRILGLDDEALLSMLRSRTAPPGDPLARAEALRCRKGVDPSLSILDALFRLGPDAIFALLEPF